MIPLSVSAYSLLHAHTHTHTLSLVWFTIFVGTLHRRNVFILYKLYILSPFTNTHPKPIHHTELYALKKM